MTTTKKKVTNLRKDAELVARDLVNASQSRLRQVTTVALESAEKVLAAAHQGVQKLRTQVNKRA